MSTCLLFAIVNGDCFDLSPEIFYFMRAEKKLTLILNTDWQSTTDWLERSSADIKTRRKGKVFTFTYCAPVKLKKCYIWPCHCRPCSHSWKYSPDIWGHPWLWQVCTLSGSCQSSCSCSHKPQLVSSPLFMGWNWAASHSPVPLLTLLFANVIG